MDHHPPAGGPVFVVGCPRSGTTLLTLMLSSHSRLSIPPETRFLLPVFRGVGSFGDLQQIPNRRRLARAVVRPRGTKFRHLRLDPERVKKEIVAGRPTIGAALSTPYRIYADERGKARWGDKRPTYFRNIALIRALFPDAQVVHVVRDPRDCVASLRRMHWWRHGTVGALATWVHAVDCARRAERRLPAGSYVQLRYEDLVAEPRSELVRLCRFLGEDFEEAMLAPQSEAERLPARQRENWHGETRESVGTQRIGRYAELLAPDEVALVEAVAGSRMRRLGYAMPGRASASTKARLRVAGTLASMRLRTRVLAARDSALVRRHGPVSYR
ncbi:MAG TPA: sulfotransferase [Actinomycetes bacterium]|jgi:hypothetical protein|nr:sulfotransferase [Actinomycetes bacterium]